MIRTEIWKPVEGFEGLYEVSSHGNIKALGKRIDSGHCHRDFPERIMQPAPDKDGYLRIALYDADHKAHTLKVHRLVAKAFIDNPGSLPQINHKDGNKANNHVGNLEWCDQSHNMKHAVRMGLVRLDGIYNPMHKLRMEDVEFIRNHYLPRDKIYGQIALGKRYGVSKKTIENIVLGKSWKEKKHDHISGSHFSRDLHDRSGYS